MSSLSRIDKAQTRRALAKFRNGAEERISEMTGAQERARVFRAIQASAQAREQRELAGEMEKAVQYAVARERGRCLAICGLLPANHTAHWIAEQIKNLGGTR